MNDVSSLKKKITCLCIGAQKAGTTWLNEQLLRHNQLYLPPIKEAHYFNFLHSPQDRGWIAEHYQRPSLVRVKELMEEKQIDWKTIAYYSRITSIIQSGTINEDWYHDVYSLCPDQNLLKIDITPAYLSMPKSGIKEVYDYNPEIKLIVLLREPVSRALSAARMMLKREKIFNPSDDNWHSIVRGHGIIEKSRYSRQIDTWLSVFDAKQFLIIPYEKISAAPVSVINDVCNFLNISEMHQNDLVLERIHQGRDYPVPETVKEWLCSRLHEEITAIKAMFPFLSEWWI